MSTKDLDGKVAEALQKLKVRLEESPSSFISEFGHSINNPLTAIMGYVNMAYVADQSNQMAKEVDKGVQKFNEIKRAIVAGIKDMEYDKAFNASMFYEKVWKPFQVVLSEYFTPIALGAPNVVSDDIKGSIKRETEYVARFIKGSGRLLEEGYIESLGSRVKEDGTKTGEEAARAAYDAGQEAGKQRILVVDDEPVVREAVAQMLGAGGYDVCTASGGQEAIQMLEEACRAGKQYDGLVTDINMPGVSGKKVLEVAKRLRVGALALTGRPDEIPDAIRAGAHCGVGKPIGVDELLPYVESALSQYK